MRNDTELLIHALATLEDNKGDRLLTKIMNDLAKLCFGRIMSVDSGLTEEEAFLVKDKQKLYAVKLVKVRLGCGLMDAKILVEEWMMRNLGYTHYPQC